MLSILPLRQVLFALKDTAVEVFPMLLKTVLNPVSKSLVNKYVPKPSSPWLLGQTRISEPAIPTQFRGQSLPPKWEGHKTSDRILVFHRADKAGDHLEQYLVIGKTAYNIGVKRLTPIMSQNIKTNNSGKLTQNSKDYLVKLLRTEYENRAWLAQTTDHDPETEARAQWWNNDPRFAQGYGAGQLREVIDDRKVDVFRTGQTIEYRDYLLNPEQDSYLYCIMGEKAGVRRTNIFSLGFKKVDEPTPHSRLHLKSFIGEENFDKFLKYVNKDGEPGVITIKEDGASFHFRSGPKGTDFWSPRPSKATGQRINYNAKVKSLRHIKTKDKVMGMGELLYEQNGRVLRAHEIGGILNSNSPVPDNVHPKLIIYRIDQINRTTVNTENYKDNYKRIEKLIAEINNPRVLPPVLVRSNILQVGKSGEGLVGIPSSQDIFHGAKFKTRPDQIDAVIEKVEFKPGSKGGIEGVVWYRDDKDKSGRLYKTGSGFTHAQKLHMKEHEKDYIGAVMRLDHFAGHGSRAATFNSFSGDFHLDKGPKPPDFEEVWQ